MHYNIFFIYKGEKTLAFLVTGELVIVTLYDIIFKIK